MNLLSKPFYFTFFKGVQLQSKSDKEAFHITEAHMLECYGCNMYADYETFKVELYRFTDKKFLPPEVKSLLKKKGYFIEFQKLTAQGFSQESAWIDIETRLFKELGIYIFNSFPTFRKFISRFINQKGWTQDTDLFIVRRYYPNQVVSQKLTNHKIKSK